MSVFRDPEEHAANPPESWLVGKRGMRWALTTKAGDVLDTYATRRQALEARESGPLARLYRQEAIWYAGGEVPGWRPYADIVAEDKARAERAYARMVSQS